MTQVEQRRNIYRRAAIAYVAACALPFFILLVSLKGAGWRPVLVGLPAYVTFFGAITYQFAKELRAPKYEEREAEESTSSEDL